MSKPRQQSNLDVGRYLDLGVRMFVFLVLFTFAGYGLDRWLSTYPLLLVIGAIVGTVAGMSHVVYSVLRESSEDKDRRGPGDEEP